MCGLSLGYRYRYRFAGTTLVGDECYLSSIEDWRFIRGHTRRAPCHIHYLLAFVVKCYPSKGDSTYLISQKKFCSINFSKCHRNKTYLNINGENGVSDDSSKRRNYAWCLCFWAWSGLCNIFFLYSFLF